MNGLAQTTQIRITTFLDLSAQARMERVSRLFRGAMDPAHKRLRFLNGPDYLRTDKRPVPWRYIAENFTRYGSTLGEPGSELAKRLQHIFSIVSVHPNTLERVLSRARDVNHNTILSTCLVAVAADQPWLLTDPAYFPLKDVSPFDGVVLLLVAVIGLRETRPRFETFVAVCDFLVASLSAEQVVEIGTIFRGSTSLAVLSAISGGDVCKMLALYNLFIVRATCSDMVKRFVRNSALFQDPEFHPWKSTPNFGPQHLIKAADSSLDMFKYVSAAMRMNGQPSLPASFYLFNNVPRCRGVQAFLFTIYDGSPFQYREPPSCHFDEMITRWEVEHDRALRIARAASDSRDDECDIPEEKIDNGQANHRNRQRGRKPQQSPQQSPPDLSALFAALPASMVCVACPSRHHLNRRSATLRDAVIRNAPSLWQFLTGCRAFPGNSDIAAVIHRFFQNVTKEFCVSKSDCSRRWLAIVAIYTASLFPIQARAPLADCQPLRKFVQARAWLYEPWLALRTLPVAVTQTKQLSSGEELLESAKNCVLSK